MAVRSSILMFFGVVLLSCSVDDGSASLEIDSTCRNGTEVSAAGETWLVAPPGDIPDDWRFVGDVDGQFERTGENTATFTVDTLELELGRVIGGARLAECDPWQ